MAALLFYGSLSRSLPRYNSRMPAPRHLIAFLLLLAGLQAATVIYAAGVPDGLEATRSLAHAGARHLALRRIDTLQPQDAAAPAWVEWEHLRLQLLVQLGRNDEVLQQAGALP